MRWVSAIACLRGPVIERAINVESPTLTTSPASASATIAADNRPLSALLAATAASARVCDSWIRASTWRSKSPKSAGITVCSMRTMAARSPCWRNVRFSRSFASTWRLARSMASSIAIRPLERDTARASSSARA
ncbi:hypothetical protein D3C72_1010710 [compost metagenome]